MSNQQNMTPAPGDPTGKPSWTISRAVGVEALVCADIARRQQQGIAKYGVTVADNPLTLSQWLQHAYEETLDLAIYLKRALVEMNRLNELAATPGLTIPETVLPSVEEVQAVFAASAQSVNGLPASVRPEELIN